MTEYTYQLSDAELARYRAMAAHALAREETLWTAAGIVPGARVVDLGCGPGAFLADLAERAGSPGRVTGVDDAEEAVRAAGALIRQLDLGGRVDVVRVRIEDTGLAAGSFDVAFMRNVLVHNGPLLNVILQHITALLRPGGHLLSVEPDVTGLLIPDTAPEEQDLEQRWVTMMRKRGNDPALGRQLAAVLAKAGFGVDAAQDRVDELAVDRSPAWTARHALLADQLATEDDIRRWESAISHRLSTTGKLTVQLPVYCVVAARP
ncbi:MAG: class I SAM-dependent methyltransferase [Streptosporangiaceae bacterium]